MTDKSIIYVIQIGLGDVDDIVWKVGKALPHTLDQRIQNAYDAIESSHIAYGDVFWKEVNGNGRFHEQAMQTAFSLAFAPIKSQKATWTEYYSPYIKFAGTDEIKLRDYTIEGVENAFDTLSASKGGTASLLGRYLATCISWNAHMNTSNDIEPAYCYRDEYGINVNPCVFSYGFEAVQHTRPKLSDYIAEKLKSKSTNDGEQPK